jgi:hypothetical protein
MKNKLKGSTLDDFLKEEGIFEEVSKNVKNKIKKELPKSVFDKFMEDDENRKRYEKLKPTFEKEYEEAKIKENL